MSIGLSTRMSRGSRGGTKHLEMNGVIVICCWFPWQPIPCKDSGHVEAAMKFKQCAGSQDESDYGVRSKVQLLGIQETDDDKSDHGIRSRANL